MFTKSGSLSIISVLLGAQKVFFIWSSEVFSLFRGCLSIKVNGRTVGMFPGVCYIVDAHC